jgi:acetoin utilization protein AcuB
MIAIDLISDEIPPLRVSDTGSRALHWMEEFKVSHLPLLKGTEYLGLISYSDILDLNKTDAPLSKHRLSLIRPYIYDNAHIYDVIKVVHLLGLTIIPVLNEQDKYLGSITLFTLVDKFAAMTAVTEPGGILVLELNVNDYALGEISRLVEGNDAKILSLYVGSIPESTKLELTLKINRLDLSPIIQTFERFNYVIKATYYESGHTEDVKNRFDSFMNYLNM